MLMICVKRAMKEATERNKIGFGWFTKKSILTLMSLETDRIFFMLRLNLTMFLNDESGW